MAETGHAKNIEHFAQLIVSCTNFGGAYDPSNAALAITELENKLQDAEGAMNGVTTDLIPWKVAVNNRQDGFEGIRKRTTRAINAFEAAGVPSSAVADARTFKRKIDGARAAAIEEVPAEPGGEVEEPQTNSVSQQSYTQLVEHLDNFIGVLKAYPAYAPNETDLTIASFETYSTSLKTLNTNVMNTIVPLDNARIARDEVLYAEGTGLVDTALLVKKYVKSVFGADSPQFQQVNSLAFRKVK